MEKMVLLWCLSFTGKTNDFQQCKGNIWTGWPTYWIRCFILLYPGRLQIIQIPVVICTSNNHQLLCIQLRSCCSCSSSGSKDSVYPPARVRHHVVAIVARAASASAVATQLWSQAVVSEHSWSGRRARWMQHLSVHLEANSFAEKNQWSDCLKGFAIQNSFSVWPLRSCGLPNRRPNCTPALWLDLDKHSSWFALGNVYIDALQILTPWQNQHLKPFESASLCWGLHYAHLPCMEGWLLRVPRWRFAFANFVNGLTGLVNLLRQTSANQVSSLSTFSRGTFFLCIIAVLLSSKELPSLPEGHRSLKDEAKTTRRSDKNCPHDLKQIHHAVEERRLHRASFQFSLMPSARRALSCWKRGALPHYLSNYLSIRRFKTSIQYYLSYLSSLSLSSILSIQSILFILYWSTYRYLFFSCLSYRSIFSMYRIFLVYLSSQSILSIYLIYLICLSCYFFVYLPFLSIHFLFFSSPLLSSLLLSSRFVSSHLFSFFLFSSLIFSCLVLSSLLLSCLVLSLLL